MKKKTNVFITVFIVLFLLAIIYPFTNLSLPDPPVLDVSAENTKIEITDGRFCAIGFLGSKCVTDDDYDSTFAMGMNHEPVVVSPGSKIEFSFSKVPNDGSVVVKRIEEKGERTRLDDVESVIVAPEKKGVYVYYIAAEWDEKNMFKNYAFSIRVK